MLYLKAYDDGGRVAHDVTRSGADNWHFQQLVGGGDGNKSHCGPGRKALDIVTQSLPTMPGSCCNSCLQEGNDVSHSATKNIEHLLATMGLNWQPFKFQVHHKGEQGVLDNLTGQ